MRKPSVSFQLLVTQVSYHLKKCIGAERHPIQFFFGCARNTLLTYCYSGTLKPAACLWRRRWRVIVRVLSTLKQRNNINQQDFWRPLYLTFSHLPSSTSLEVLCNQRVCKRVVVRVLILKCLPNTQGLIFVVMFSLFITYIIVIIISMQCFEENIEKYFSYYPECIK